MLDCIRSMLLCFMSGPMKAKNLIFILSCFVASSIFVYLLSDQQPTLHSIVSETHKQLNNLKNLKDNLKATERIELTVDEKYLQVLGFTSSPRLYPADAWNNATLPVFVTTAASGQTNLALGFINSVRRHFPDRTVVVYDLGLAEYELTMIAQLCNSSLCFVKKFNFDDFPTHVSDSTFMAYRPLIIQDMLSLAGAVFYVNIGTRFISNKLDNLLQQASSVGLATWSINQPTSALTHPRMFDYFRTTQQNFYFHHMAEPDHVILYNTADIHKSLMLPWVQCSLISECIAPIGAQSSGCRFDKKPMYRYSGCHRYDASAFNVALGVMFNFIDTRYTSQEKLFRMVEDLSNEEEGFGGNNETVSRDPRDEYVQ